jgi:demethylmenaquinone methyltransferase/2-methoxy-6-polyprenyl-1,4-benzoquinol methylase
MLSRAAQKFDAVKSTGRSAIAFEADALRLPLQSASLDLLVTAFGFRNLANYEAGLEEFLRVLKPGGQLGILDFSEPGGVIGKVYAIYFRRVLPAIGKLVIGPASSPASSSSANKPEPYSYLPTSVGNFPAPAEMLELMRAVGYAECLWQPYTFGIAGLYTAKRATL